MSSPGRWVILSYTNGFYSTKLLPCPEFLEPQSCVSYQFSSSFFFSPNCPTSFLLILTVKKGTESHLLLIHPDTVQSCYQGSCCLYRSWEHCMGLFEVPEEVSFPRSPVSTSEWGCIPVPQSKIRTCFSLGLIQSFSWLYFIRRCINTFLGLCIKITFFIISNKSDQIWTRVRKLNTQLSKPLGCALPCLTWAMY